MATLCKMDLRMKKTVDAVLREVLEKAFRVFQPGTPEYHRRWCSDVMFPCRCAFDNDEDYRKYGDAFIRVKL